MDFQNISNLLENWYFVNKRDLPWRKTKDPYTIWVSEIIMQQTKITQGTPYFLKFIEKFPTVNILAESSIEEVLVLWQGLGYYSRARNMHHTAKQIMLQYNGIFPNSYNDLILLKGIGKYTAAAISSISNSEKKAVVDGNVTRWIARLCNITEVVDTIQTQKKIEHVAQKIILYYDAGIINQAMMEFGSLVCTPNKPDCANCPFIHQCISYKESTQHIIPQKKPKKTITTRIFKYYYIYHPDGRFIITQRTENDIWKGLFELPLIEKKNLEPDKRDKVFQKLSITKSIKLRRHILSHQHIDATIHFVSASNSELAKIANQINGTIISNKTIDNYPFSKLLQTFFLLISEQIAK